MAFSDSTSVNKSGSFNEYGSAVPGSRFYLEVVFTWILPCFYLLYGFSLLRGFIRVLRGFYLLPISVYRLEFYRLVFVK